MDSSAKQFTGESVELNLENDSRNLGGPGSDNSYTNGMRISYLFADDEMPAWGKFILYRNETIKKEFEKSKTNFGVSLSQQIFTPIDDQTKKIILDDRAYAGWLYLSANANFQSTLESHIFNFDFGVIGKSAQGENVQSSFHKFIHTSPANGWNNELANHIALQLSYQTRSKVKTYQTLELKNYMDFISYYGFSVGNVFINSHIGGILRIGFQLPEDFGPTGASSSDGIAFISPVARTVKQTGFYGFIGGKGILVAKNYFLDENISPLGSHLTKYPFLLETEVGWGFIWERWIYNWRFITKSPEFTQKSYFTSFASMNLLYSF